MFPFTFPVSTLCGAALKHCTSIVQWSPQKRVYKKVNFKQTEMKNSLKELCHKNNGCGAIDIYMIQQGAVQANQKKKWFYTQFMQYGWT